MAEWTDTIEFAGVTYRARMTATQIIVLFRAAEPDAAKWHLRKPVEVRYAEDGGDYKQPLEVFGNPETREEHMLEDRFGFRDGKKPLARGLLPRRIDLKYAKDASPALRERIQAVYARAAEAKRVANAAYIRKSAEGLRQEAIREEADALLEAALVGENDVIQSRAASYRGMNAKTWEDFVAEVESDDD